MYVTRLQEFIIIIDFSPDIIFQFLIPKTHIPWFIIGQAVLSKLTFKSFFLPLYLWIIFIIYMFY